MSTYRNKEFLTRFIASARIRLEKAQKVIDSPEHADGRALGMDIHLIWGEAAMLDLPQIAHSWPGRQSQRQRAVWGFKTRPRLASRARRPFVPCRKSWL
jgi:hypothetical protein